MFQSIYFHHSIWEHSWLASNSKPQTLQAF